MESVIELHDSVVTACNEPGEEIVIRLSPAYLHRSPGRAGVEAGDVFILDLDIRLRGGEFRRPFAEIPTELQGGSLAAGDHQFDNCLPFPLNVGGSVTLRLTDYYGHEVEVSAQAISLVSASAETWLEPFVPSRQMGYDRE